VEQNVGFSRVNAMIQFAVSSSSFPKNTSFLHHRVVFALRALFMRINR
jgi:hypothetical protein